MSILLSHEKGWIVSHPACVENIYKQIGYKYRDILFSVFSPYLRDGQKGNTKEESIVPNGREKRKRHITFSSDEIPVEHVSNTAQILIKEGKKNNYFIDPVTSPDAAESNNSTVKETVNNILCRETKTHVGKKFSGGLSNEVPAIVEIEREKYILPPHCRFFCYNVKDITLNMELLKPPFDFIVLDPPWRNKYIRRKKAKCDNSAYHMMYDEELLDLPVKNLVKPGTIVAVWCTNSESHIKYLKEHLFPAWGLEFVGKWYWMKVTCTGVQVCQFQDPPGKQPFEQIVFGQALCLDSRRYPLPEDGKVIVSVPSAIHSHKPPLTDVVAKYLPPDPVCLELFARYLLPGWTSWGNDVIRLQHMSLYEENT